MLFDGLIAIEKVKNQYLQETTNLKHLLKKTYVKQNM